MDAYKGFFKNNFYKLLPTRWGENTLEINGVRMHQTALKSPMQDARDKAAALDVRPDSIVLDICTGLGYSTLACLDYGVKKIYTLEKDENVLAIAKQNPASSRLFTEKRIEIINKDALVAVPEFPAGSFDFILHDPPRFSFAGELYSLAFYKELYRVLKKNGRLFHYTGTPGAAGGKNIPKGVKQRLREAGFHDVYWIDHCLGFMAQKLKRSDRRPIGEITRD